MQTSKALGPNRRAARTAPPSRPQRAEPVSRPSASSRPVETCACGGGCPRCTSRAAVVQRKPTINAPDDPFEREADAVADQVMRMAEPESVAPSPGAAGRAGAAGEDDRKVVGQTKRTPAAHATAGLDVGTAVHAAGRGGVPLSAETRAYFEPRFGRDFSRVRVHADGEAERAARSVRARAYTFGDDIVFAAGEYSPSTLEGRRLLAHELAHVVQQTPWTDGDPHATRDMLQRDVDTEEEDWVELAAGGTQVERSGPGKKGAEQAADPAQSPGTLYGEKFMEVGSARKAFLHFAFMFPYEEPDDPFEKEEWKRGERMAIVFILAQEIALRGMRPGGPGSTPKMVTAGGAVSVPIAAAPAAPSLPVYLASSAVKDEAKETSAGSPPKASSAGPSPEPVPQATSSRGAWSLPPNERGTMLEEIAPLPGKKINGKLADFDRFVPDPGGEDLPAREVGQTKSIDTALPGYTRNPRSLYNALMRRIGEVAAIGEGIWFYKGQKVLVTQQTARVFDVLLPPEPRTPAQDAQLSQLTQDAAAIGVEVRLHVYP